MTYRRFQIRDGYRPEPTDIIRCSCGATREVPRAFTIPLTTRRLGHTCKPDETWTGLDAALNEWASRPRPMSRSARRRTDPATAAVDVAQRSASIATVVDVVASALSEPPAGGFVPRERCPGTGGRGLDSVAPGGSDRCPVCCRDAVKVNSDGSLARHNATIHPRKELTDA